MFDDSKLLKNWRCLKVISEEMMKSKAEMLFDNARKLQAGVPAHRFQLNEIASETLAEQFILLGGRSEFLEGILPLERSKLKNIQRRLEKQGVLDGIVHYKRTLTGIERTVKAFLDDGRITISLFLMIYETLDRSPQHGRINLYYFLVSYFLTKEIFEHPQIYTIEIPGLPIDLAFFFCREFCFERVHMFYCPHCGQVYSVFSFESSMRQGIKCPYCQLLSAKKERDLKRQLKTGFI